MKSRLTSALIIVLMLSSCGIRVASPTLLPSVETLVSETPSIQTVDSEVSDGTYDESLPSRYEYSYQTNMENEMLALVNEYRVQNGLGTVTLNPELQITSRWKSNAMLQLNYFGHSNPQFGDMASYDMIRQVFGFTHFELLGENLASIATTDTARMTALELFNIFKGSPKHNENMLNPQWTAVGFGILISTSSGQDDKRPVNLCTQHFGIDEKKGAN